MRNASIIEKYFLVALLAIVLVITIAIFYPFITVVILSGAFAVLLDPIYQWIKRRVTRGRAWIASMLAVIVFLIALCAPIFFIGKIVFNQAENAYQYVTLSDGNELVKKIDLSVNRIMPNGITFDTKEKVNSLGIFVANNIANFAGSIFHLVLMFLLMIFSIFYLLKDGKEWKKNLISLSPLSEDHMEEILSKLRNAINRILKGNFFIAITQGVLVGIGFSIFGVPNGALWGLVAGLASFIPTIGTSVISIPAILFLYVSGAHIQAIGLLIWSFVMVGLIDNALAPYVISKNTEIPSLFILFSILGGISLMGPVGVLIGPLTLSLLYALVSIYRKETKSS